ncbi:hypothetical protein [Nodularia spumigena]|uniref:hypothetical protein n=1 Tax=Nodularia spumigena TaxID=70799 RepID=UPI00232D81E5|nr:hypothetical protein [Nodularia spumigena]MDB9348960.1 hypothetical protein [Nodularia spumigena CS-588/01]MDB9350881.1 hypothetical protein [Nodularia spumigena CS-588/05]
MVDLTLPAALAIAKIAYTKFFESSIGKLGEKFTETGLQKKLMNYIPRFGKNSVVILLLIGL